MEQENPTPTEEINEDTNSNSFTYNPNGTPNPKKSRSVTSILGLIILAVIAVSVIGTGFVFWAANPSLHQSGRESSNRSQTTTSKKSPESTETSLLVKLTEALCKGSYTTLYKPDDESGIFQCENQAIYTVSSTGSKNFGQYTSGRASYIGTTKDALVNKYFNDTFYIYRDYEDNGTSVDLILLVEANSEQAAADKIANSTHSFLTEYLRTHTRGSFRIVIFYNEQLDTIKNTRDYVILSGVIGVYGMLPGGPIKNDRYSFSSDNASALSKIGADPTLYSTQTRNAVKNHRHAIMKINLTEPLASNDTFRVNLINSFTEKY